MMLQIMYCISGTYWMQMTTVLLWHMMFLLMTTAILLRAEFSNVLQRYSLTYSITYMFIVLYMESMLFSRLLLLYLHIFTLIFLISVNNADWRLHWRQQKKVIIFDTLFWSRKVGIFLWKRWGNFDGSCEKSDPNS